MWHAVRLPLILVAPLFAAASLAAQGGGGDFSRRPFVFERLHRDVVFNADGTYRLTLDVRARIQTTAGLRPFGQIAYPYASENQRLDIDYVRVLKAGGDTVNAPASAIQDLNVPLAQEAPMYSDLREKVITVPGLQPGDTIEYHVTWTTRMPFAPGNFWDRFEFIRKSIVLDERITYSVPRTTAVQVKTEGGPDPKTTDAGDRQIYTWQLVNLTIDTTEQPESFIARRAAHAITLTTFRSWADVGAWYAGLERARELVTPDIERRAAELVRGRTTLRDSIAALYDFVSQRFRYVSLDFGIGRFQPHAAADVLANQYGDCKDKHVLLAALLRAIGVSSAPVLISSEQPIDPDLPSPQEFDHLITFVQARGDSLYLDATPGTAPFGFLMAPLRGKQALLMPDSGTPRLARVPAAAPFPTYTLIDAAGALSDLGGVAESVRYESRGDVEVILRELFRQLSEDKWPAFAQRLAVMGDLEGTVSTTTATDPTATAGPFAFTFQIERRDAVTWSGQHAELTVPLPMLDLPTIDTARTRDPADSLPVGLLEQEANRVRLVLPPGVTARLPATLTLRRDFGDYQTSAPAPGDTLIVERVLKWTRRMLAPARLGDFVAFGRVLKEDQDRTITLTRAAGAVTATAAAGASAEDLHRQGMAALEEGDARGAVRALRRATQLEPLHQFAWNNLGRAYLQLGKLDSAEYAMRKQIEVNPYDQYAYNNLGLVLRRLGRREEAIAAFSKQIQVNPLDRYAHANLGRLLVDMHRDSAAADALEHAVSITPEDTALHLLLGNAYLRLRRGADALAAVDRALAPSPPPDMWNNVAYTLAVQRVELDSAEELVHRAIDAVEGRLKDLTIDDVGIREVLATSSLGAYWDTLGWIYFGRGDLANAERYVRAAWLLTFSSEVGEHLGQIETRLGRREAAIHSYALAANATQPSKSIRPRLVALLGGSERETDRRIGLATNELVRLRTIQRGTLLNDVVSTEVMVLMGGGRGRGPADAAHIESVRLTNGSPRLAGVKTAIRNASIDARLPDEGVQLVRRGLLTCSSPSGNCAFVFMPE